MNSPRSADSLSARDSSVGMLATLTVVLAVPVLGVAAYLAGVTHLELRADTGDDDSLAGLGYVFTVVLGVPGLVAVLLAVAGHRLQRTRPRTALVTAVLGLLIVSVPALALVVAVLGPL